MAVATRKRPAPEQQEPREAAGGNGKKQRAQCYSFGSIHDYEKVGVIGEGAFGVVFRAHHRRTGRDAAVKWVRRGDGAAPDLIRAVTREAGCLAACRGRHPSVVRIEDLAADAATGDVFLVMELVGRGRSLWDRLAGAPFSEDEARATMRQLLGAAEVIHGAGVIHRDIKPENVLVGPGGEIKICDFGLATLQKDDGEGLVGTMIYNSPEQLTGSRCYGAAVDMWALGCVMAELLTGERLFDVDNEEDLLAEVFEMRDMLAEHGPSGFLARLPEMSRAGREVLAGLLAFDPRERLTAAAALEHRWFTQEAESA